MNPSQPKSLGEPMINQLAPDRETLALLKILELGMQDVAAGKVKPASEVVARLRGRIPMHARSDAMREQLLAGAISVPAAAADASYFDGLRARLRPSDQR